ncbi:LysM peptidoglycan-binding domain-containing protein [Streptacidiphilus sp. N1-3]|uniref:LysM peptidoglycan-binding domain-containing protein n=1 Tax=Streptacidiphilus alkalitolerans TaxID=3342712 RepID=A0ABV6X2I6_9ACTN
MSKPSPRHARPRTPLLRSTTAAASLTAAGIGAGVLGASAAQAATPTSTTPVTSYTVKSGDSLSGIAAKEHVPGGYTALAKANKIKSPYVIHPGEKLTLPKGSYVTSAPALPFPVAVTVGSATQVITVKASGSTATVTAWQKSGSTWTAKYKTTAARIGSAGITAGSTRKQGTDTTPTGTYTITQGFGVGANPGTTMPYHQVTTTDWWVEDPTSAYYNQMRTSTQGGFHLAETGDDGSEHLIEYPTQYNNALVINYNMNPAVKGRGAGIFLHDLGPQAGPTAGCVALPAAVMTQIIKWINPANHPVIAIG